MTVNKRMVCLSFERSWPIGIEVAALLKDIKLCRIDVYFSVVTTRRERLSHCLVDMKHVPSDGHVFD